LRRGKAIAHNSGEASYVAATFIHDYYTRAAGPVFLLAYIHASKGTLLGGLRHPKRVSQNHLTCNNQIVVNLSVDVMTKSGEPEYGFREVGLFRQSINRNCAQRIAGKGKKYYFCKKIRS
jgi:hypothetical protein